MPAHVHIIHAAVDTPSRRALEYALAYLTEPKRPDAEIDPDHDDVEPPLAIPVQALHDASVMLVLLSPELLASEEARELLRAALDLRRQGKAEVVGLWVREADLSKVVLDGIRILPRDAGGQLVPLDRTPPDSTAWLRAARELEPLLRQHAFSPFFSARSSKGLPTSRLAILPAQPGSKQPVFQPEQAPLASEPKKEAPGEGLILGRYKRKGEVVRHELCGDVVSAISVTHTPGGRPVERSVALKLRRETAPMAAEAVAADKARLMREADVLSTLASPQFLRIYDFGEDSAVGPVLVLEAQRGEPLMSRIEREGPMTFSIAFPIFEQLFQGLVALHKEGIAHRHVSATNIWLGAHPNGDLRVILCDLSGCLRKGRDDDRADTAAQEGFFSFAAPESLGGWSEAGFASDLYAAATCLFWALTGRLPFDAKNVLQAIEMKTRSEAPRLGEAMSEGVNPALELFLARALARSPEHRFASAETALAAFQMLR